MGDRTFQDRTGTVWRVSEITPDADSSKEARERRVRGRSTARTSSKKKAPATRPQPWLCFESKSERLRVSSVPGGWVNLPDDELEDLLAYARPA